jgi:hypothetical protein
MPIADFVIKLFNLIENLAMPIVVEVANFGQPQGAGGTVEQGRLDFVFKASNGFTDGGGGKIKFVGGGSKAITLGGDDKDLEGFEFVHGG